MKTIFIAFLLCLPASRGARILGFFPFPARSHYMLGSALMKGLAEKGHDITVISSFGEKNHPKNGTYRDIVLTEILEEMQEKRNDLNMFDMAGINPVLNVGIMAYIFTQLTEQVFNHTAFQSFISSKSEKFDVVIVEQFFNDADKALSTHFKAPLVILSTIGANSWLNNLVGNPAPPSYISEQMLSYSGRMTFCERLKNIAVRSLNMLINELYVYPQHNQIVKKYIPNSPNLYDVLYNASLVLLTSHPSTNPPVPYVPNMIDIGGFHVQPPKQLPKDLQEFMDRATDGVIYFSMGSNLKSSEFPAEKRDAFLKAFSKLKQKVLWKWESDSLPGQPANVKLGKWLPQQDILAHPNLKLFITHGGFLSTTETVYHGVPILAIPIVGDQKLNAKVATDYGFGLTLSYSEISEETLTKSLNELLYDPKYKGKAKAMSTLFHDRPIKPMDAATYWVEYVIRHRGTPHLRVAALDLPWYQYFLLDIIAFICAVLVIVLYIVYIILKLIFKKLFGSDSSKEKVKTN